MTDTNIGRYALIENGVVANVIVADPEFAASVNAILCAEQAGPGWLYDGTAFTAPPPPPEPVAPPAPTKEELLAQLAALQAQIVAMKE